MIVIVDYGMGNLRSVQKAFQQLGFDACISSEPDRVGTAERLVLPGVGAFGDAIDRLHRAGLVEPIRDHVLAGKPFLGICLGMQLLMSRSFEGGEFAGLDLVAGDVVRFDLPPEFKVPHMGWNVVEPKRPVPLLDRLPTPMYAYFVHSYYVVPQDAAVVAAQTTYHTPFASVLWRERLFATQFHPEKSQRLGLALLHNFATVP